jgi:two-component system KDP operon response regulator KdpE
MDRPRILIVDDEPKVIRLVTTNLRTKGYEVIEAATGGQALRAAAEAAPHVMLLDVMLPDMEGYEVCRRMREFTDAPIIMLTAKAREVDKLAGFRAGADDYVTKPFSVKELLARIEVALRRRNGDAPAAASLTVKGITVDLAARRVLAGGKPVALTPTEYSLFALLLSNRGKVLFHEQILGRIWGPEYAGNVDYLRVYVSHLRRKLGDAGSKVIRTVTGVGYTIDDEETR